MSLHKARPTSAGRRFVVSVKTPELYKGQPHAALVEKKTSTGGRNNNGRITVRHQGGKTSNENTVSRLGSPVSETTRALTV